MVARTNYHKVKHILITPQFWRSEVFLSYRQGVGRAVFPLESQGILRWESIPHLFQFLGIPAFVVISMSAWSLLLCKLTYSQVLRIRMWASLGAIVSPITENFPEYSRLGWQPSNLIEDDFSLGYNRGETVFVFTTVNTYGHFWGAREHVMWMGCPRIYHPCPHPRADCALLITLWGEHHHLPDANMPEGKRLEKYLIKDILWWDAWVA